MGHICLFQILICIAFCAAEANYIKDNNMLRTWFKCEPCEKQLCPKPSMYCMEYVKEPGYCSCCLTCAREEGERCGVNTAPCMKGLECSPIMAKDPQSTWNDFMLDHAVCLPKKPKGKCHAVEHWDFC